MLKSEKGKVITPGIVIRSGIIASPAPEAIRELAKELCCVLPVILGRILLVFEIVQIHSQLQFV